jgi:hypothetical protein
MKNTIILLLALTTITLAVVCATQSRKSAAQQIEAAALRGEVQAQSQQIENLQAGQKRSEGQRRELMGQAEELAAQLQARRAAETTVAAPAPATPPPLAQSEKPDGGKGGFGKMLSKMMQDPDTREVVRTQQRMMMEQLYTPLIKKMGLAPDEAAKFNDLLVDNAMKASEKAFSMLEGLGTTNRAELIKNLGAGQKTFDEQVKALLGDERYAQYTDYQETVGERTMLNQFKQQAGSDYNLTEPQTEALLAIMKEEKKSVATTTGLPLEDTNKDPAKILGLLSDGKVDELLQGQETVSQRVYDRARTFLSPDQLESLGKFQTNQMRMMRMSMTMARKMFAPDQSAAGAASPNQ